MSFIAPSQASFRLDSATPVGQPRRDTVHESFLALVESVSVPATATPAGYETVFQVAVTLSGLFGYRTGSISNFFDANQTLFVSPDREFADTHPVEGLGHHSLIITPSRPVLDELCGRQGAQAHAAFSNVVRRTTAETRLLAHRLAGGKAVGDPLQRDEATIALISAALAAPVSPPTTRPRLVERTKELLHARSAERMLLAEIADEVGVSPVYLTQEFKRAEGIPLYRYQTQLRLNRALIELPRSEDITELALELGFYSHSHFSAAFRQAFGVTPSAYRTEAARGSVVRQGRSNSGRGA